jgi:hypothetical protein
MSTALSISPSAERQEKTTLLEHLITDYLRTNTSAVVIDPHGDLGCAGGCCVTSLAGVSLVNISGQLFMSLGD